MVEAVQIVPTDGPEVGQVGITVVTTGDANTIEVIGAGEGGLQVQAIDVLLPGAPGLKGEQGPPGDGAQIFRYTLTNTSSFSANHGLSYTPKWTLTLPSGEEVETDVVQLPGLTYFLFPQPFTGALTLY